MNMHIKHLLPTSAVQAGFGQFFVGKYIASTWSANGNGSADGTWGYLQATVNF